MARKDTEKEFAYYENLSIKLDIAIDEQNSEECDKIVKIKNTYIDNIKIANSPLAFRRALIENGNIIKIKVNDNTINNDFWQLYFLAKRLRGILLDDNRDEQIKKLDYIVDLLIRDASSNISDATGFQYLILMLELAACTTGEQSLGYAEKARNILSDNTSESFFCAWRKLAYEALIHYNQGVAKQHMGLHGSALIEYKQARKKFNQAEKKVHANHYLHNLWRHYVHNPAVLQMAEVLIKMQFSYNALIALEYLNNSRPSTFHKRRRELLKLNCYIDLSDIKNFDASWHNIVECNNANSLFIDPNNRCIFSRLKRNNGKTSFLETKKPKKPNRKVPISIASTYNSLILDRSRIELERLKKEHERKRKEHVSDAKEFDSFVRPPIISFIADYLDQCKHNRYDKLTLEESILDYIEVVAKFIKKDERFTRDDKLYLKLLEELFDLLKKNGFIEEIDQTSETPLLPIEAIKKARKIFEDINDTLLKKWVKGNDEEENKQDLPKSAKTIIEFEKDFIEQMIRIKNRKNKLVPRIYDEKSLNERKRLLSAIVANGFDLGNIEKLKEEFIVFDINNEAPRECLKTILKTIKSDQDDKRNQDLENLYFSDYDNILDREYKKLRKHTTGRSLQPIYLSNDNNKLLNSVHYVGMRRWNSYTPELSFSVGGGHFVFLVEDSKSSKGKVSIGIAVDPGFDFIRNFFRQGFTLTDIDIILLTHGHPDHIRDFPAVVELLNENKKREKDKDKKIYAIMSFGCYERLEHYISKDPFKLLFYDTIIVDVDESRKEKDILFQYIEDEYASSEQPIKRVSLIPPSKNNPANKNTDINVTIKYFKSYHNDHSESDSYGYIIDFKSKNKSSASVGFTGDSKWFVNYARIFKKCDIVCSHIGSIAEPKKDKMLYDYNSLGRAERLMRTKNHPYLFGEILFWHDWVNIFKDNNKLSLMLMSEFGEEMKGKIRCDLANRFNLPLSDKCCWTRKDIGKNNNDGETVCEKCKNIKKNMIVIPVDVGLRIQISLNKRNKKNYRSHPHRVHCILCGGFVKPDEIDYEVYSHEEAIFYVCKTCMRSTSVDVRHAIYQKYHEAGRNMEKYDE